MGILDQFMELKSKGVSNQEIVRTLQEQGVSPREISEVFGRAQIKSAVSSGAIEQGMEHSILGSEEEEPERLPLEGLEGETLSDIDLTPPIPGRLAPIPQNVTKEIPEEAQEMYNPQEAGDYYQPQQYQQNQEYAPQEGYQYQAAAVGLDTDTMIEVSEQIFMEKNKPLQKKLDEMSEFRALAQTKIDNISDRLRKIEAIIDRLQASILEKVGGYGHGLETARKEIGMMQDSFAKMVNQLAEKSEEKYRSRKQQYLNNQQPNLQSDQGYKNQNPAVNRSSKKSPVKKRSGKSSRK